MPPLSNDPALTIARTGKGSVLYAAGDFGGTIATFHTPELMALITNAARQLAARPFTLHGAPSSVEVVWRSQGAGRRLLHLVNFTGEMTRPIQSIVPLTNLRVTLHPDVQPKSVRSLMRPGTIPITRNARGQAELTVPRVDEYEVLVIEQ